MKKIQLFAIFAVLVSLNSVHAQNAYYLESFNQIGNPRGLNSEQDDYSVSNNWNLVLTDSAKKCYSSVLNLPFAFKLGSQTFTQFKVSSTGYITFSINDSKIQHPQYRDELKLPSADLPNNSIYIGGITSYGSNDQVFTKSFGTAPNRQFWVKFQSFTPVHDTMGGSYATSAIVLDENNGSIHFVDMKAAYSDIATTKYLIHNYGIQISATEAYAIGDDLGSFHHPKPNIMTKLHANNSNKYQDNVYFTFYEGQNPQLDVKISKYLNQSVLQQLDGNLFLSYVVSNIGKDSIQSVSIRHILADELGSILKDTSVAFGKMSLNQKEKHCIDTVLLAPFSGKIITHQVFIESVNGQSDNNLSNDTIENTRVLVQLQNPTGVPNHLLESVVSANFGMVPLLENQINQLTGASAGKMIAMNYHVQDKLSGLLDTLGTMRAFGFNESFVNASLVNQNQNTLSMINRGHQSERIEHTASAITKFINNQIGIKYAKATVNVSDLSYDSAKKWITGKVKFTANDYLLSTKIRLNAFLLEDNVRGNGIGYDQKINEMLSNDTVFKNQDFYGKTTPLNGYIHQNVVWSASNGFYGEKLSDFEIVFKPGDKWEWSFILPVPITAKSFTFNSANVGENGSFTGLGKVADFKVVGVLYEDLSNSSSFQLSNNQLQNGTWPVVVNAGMKKVWDLATNVNKKAVVSQLGIYPNPAVQQVNLNTVEPMTEVATLRIFDLSGQTLVSRTVVGNQLNMDISGFNSGIYVVELVYASNHKYTGKLVIQ